MTGRPDVRRPTPGWQYYPRDVRGYWGMEHKPAPDLRNNRVPVEWALQPKGACYGQPHS